MRKLRLFLVLLLCSTFIKGVDNQSGRLLEGFGSSGIFTISPLIGGSAAGKNDLNGIAATSDGNIVGVGSTSLDGPAYFLAAQISTFGSGRKMWGSYVNFSIEGTGSSIAKAVAITSSGAIRLAGYSGSSSRYAIAGFTSTGDLDTTYGSGSGVTKTGVNCITNAIISGGTTDEASCCVLQSNDYLVVGGFSTNGGGQKYYSLARFDAAGVLDSSFGAGMGYTYLSSHIIPSAGDGDAANCVGLQKSGKIILGGYSTKNVQTEFYFSAARYKTDGTLDTSFGSGGVVSISAIGSGVIDKANCLTILNDDSIVLGGQSGTRFALVKLTIDGGLDLNFGGGTGKVLLPQATGSTEDIIYGITQQPNGCLVVSGVSTINGNSNVTVLRLTSAGALDTTFGSGGTAVIPATVGTAYGVALSGDSIIAGCNLSSYFGFAKLLNVQLASTSTSLTPTDYLQVTTQLQTINANAVLALNSMPGVSNSITTSFVNAFSSQINNGATLTAAYNQAVTTAFPDEKKGYDDQFYNRFILNNNLKNIALSGSVDSVLSYGNSVENFAHILTIGVFINKITIKTYPVAYYCALYVASYVAGIAKSGNIPMGGL